MQRKIASGLLAVSVLGVYSVRAEGIVNGGFETIADWLTACPGADGEPPDYSEACVETGRQGFRIGRTVEGPERDGCTGGALAHPTFDCGGGDGLPFATLSFKARFTARDGEEAHLAYVLGAQVHTAAIPSTRTFATFRWSETTSTPWIEFSITDGVTPGVQSTLCLDEVSCESTAGDRTNQGGATPLVISDQVVVLFPNPPPEERAGYSAPRDCNENGRSDRMDILLGWARDDDGDGEPDECSLPRFRRGDADANDSLNLTDAVAILGRLFLGGAAISCQDAGDADDSGVLDLSDAVRVLNHLFLGGPALPEPSAACGRDLTGDLLDCAIFAPCVGGREGEFFGYTREQPGVILVLDAALSMWEGGCLARVLQEAEAFLAGLESRPGRSFGIVTFADAARRFPETGPVVDATPDHLAEGIEFLRSIPLPATPDACMGLGFAAALAMANAQPGRPRVEIVFASRLGGTCGGLDLADYSRRVLSEVAVRNTRRTKVHAVGLFAAEKSARQTFIEGLGATNGGGSTNAPACE